MNKIFITSSGTEIGKTFITTSLIKDLTKENYTVSALKPILTGFNEKEVSKSDSALLLEAMGLEVSIENISKITPWRYKEPLSPNIAAELENKPILYNELIDFSLSGTDEDLTLIEGIGGVMVPINNKITVIDWIKAIEIPIILVVGTYLGSLSHSLTAIKCLKSKNIKIIGIVVNESYSQPMSKEKTAKTISELTGSIPITTIPRILDNKKMPNLIPLIKDYI